MNINSAKVFITGTGSLASAVLYEFASSRMKSLEVTIASRDSQRLSWLTRAGRALAAGSGQKIDAVVIDWDDPQSLLSALRRHRPDIVLHVASWQSPWELSGKNAWSRLVAAAGFGFTLPFQLVLATRLAEAVASAVPDAMFINACYPDAVNPMLRGAGLPILCGVGNVAILAALLRADLGASSDELKLIAHHSHLSAASPRPDRLACLSTLAAWQNDENCDDRVRKWLWDAALPPDQRLNVVTANTAARLVSALLGLSGTLRTHAPGPDGLPGGYPVVCEAGRLSLNLPAGLSKQAAVEFNKAASVFDGVTIEAGGLAVFSPQDEKLAAELLGDARDLLQPMSAHLVEDRVSKLAVVKEALVKRGEA